VKVSPCSEESIPRARCDLDSCRKCRDTVWEFEERKAYRYPTKSASSFVSHFFAPAHHAAASRGWHESTTREGRSVGLSRENDLDGVFSLWGPSETSFNLLAKSSSSENKQEVSILLPLAFCLHRTLNSDRIQQYDCAMQLMKLRRV